ncbi:SDR family oxidoreductase [Sphingomonas sp. SRS2]|uniref:SDR family oxidoreductase n=1 Tax=Sphingomonas sp. SRS2 TaxID=133190 RepID=UPI00061842EB|nr:NAD(P)-dependent oxidoreductase [Sphingomonas sp. SRS2]KKC25214.1 short-chain dehydrogenase [Sphingomonas sp. SRS2]
MSLKGKTVLITGASRGIGLSIALRAAADGANIVILAKTAEPNPKLSGTIYTAADAIRAAGGNALPLVCDIRYEEQVHAAFDRAAQEFGGIDVCVNNASAISLTSTLATDMKRYDLMHAINSRGTFLCSQAAIPHLRKAANPHILNLSPPLDMSAKWFAPNVAYTMAKFGMSMCTLGMATEFAEAGIAVNSLWPLTAIDTAAVQNVLGGPEMVAASRKPEIVADAAYIVLNKTARHFTGQFLIDEEVLRAEGITDFSDYAHDPSITLVGDFFVPDEAFARSPTKVTPFNDAIYPRPSSAPEQEGAIA